MEKGGSVVWARNAFRRDQLWPGVVLPGGSVPDFIQRLQTPGRVCICFYGPSIAQSRLRDYFWLPVEELVAWADYSIPEQPEVNETCEDHAEALKAAHEEALSVDAGYLDPIQGMLPKVDPSATCCTCCGKTLKPKEAAEAKEHQDRCSDCQQLFLDGQHCAVCRRVWFKYESHTLATCKRCDARVHAACDARAEKSVKAAAAERAAAAVKQEQQEEPMDIEQQQQLAPADAAMQQLQQQQTTAPYNCPACCQKEADESRMDLLHLHAVVLADIKPNKPRPAAEIFAAEVARKHHASGGQMDLQLLQGLISKAWVDEEDKGKYERQAQQEQQGYMAAVPQYDALFRQYVNLAASLRREVDLSLALEPQRVLGSGSVVLARGSAAPPNSVAAAPAGHPLPAGGASIRGQQQAQLMSSTRSIATAAPVAPVPIAASASSSGHAGRGGRPPHVSVLGSGAVIKAEDGSDVPQQIPVLCNTTKGTFLLAEMRVICSCPSCTVLPLERRTFSPTQFEQHGGAGSAKKWKASLRIEPGGVSECPHGATPMAFGKWMEMKGIEAKGSKVSAAHTPPSPADVAQLLLDGPAASVKRERSEPQHRQPSLVAAGPTSSGEAIAASGAGGPSPASSSRGPGEGSAVGAAAGTAATTSSAEQKPATTGVPKNRRTDSWAPWDDVNLGQYKPIQVKFAGDRCCVCDSDVDFDVDRLVSCDGCGITVHQSCYGIPELPEEDDMWLCRSCELKEPGAPEPQCCLCPMTGGGLKPTTIPGLWAHAACMQWIPEVTCVEPLRMEPIDRIQHIQKERWELLCCICRQRMGAKIQCNDCYQAYHPLCARRLGLHMEMVEPAVPDGPLQLLTFCPRHCKARPEKSGITLLSPEDAFRMGRPRKRPNDAAGGSSSTAADHPSSGTAADAINNGLWNAQPFKCNKPPAAVPSAPGGCARATAFAAKQISHGTGTGRTSIAGFWIPSTDAAAVAGEGGGPDSSNNTGGGLGHQGSITSGAAAAAAAGKPGRKRRRWGKGSSAKVHHNKAAARPKAARLSASGEPPPVVELLPLPEGVPDRVSVVCNGRAATFILRPQRVRAGDQELTASRFEAMCGKGDAKKWKSSLWAVNADGEPDVCMGDWLSARGLDKAALAKLISNWTAHELRQVWEQQQQEEAAAGDDQQAVGGDADEGAGDAGDGDPVGRAESSAGEGAADGATTEDGDDVSESHADMEHGGDENDDHAAAAAVPAAGVNGECVPKTAAGRHTGPPQMDTQVQSLEQQQVSDAEHCLAADADEPIAKRQKLQEETFVPASNGGSASPAAAGAADPQQQQVDERDVGTPVLLDQEVLPEPPKPQQLQQLEDSSATAAAIANGIVAAAATATAAADGGGEEAAGHEGQQRAAAASAAARRRQKGLVLLLRMHYKQLPDTFRIHPSSLLQEAPTAKQQQQQATAAEGFDDAGSSGVEGVSATSAPWLVVGRCCRMYWPDDDAWYEADVTAYDSSSGKHKLWYHIDEVMEEIDLVAEEKEGRVQWLPLVDRLKWPKPPEKQPRHSPVGAAELGLMEGVVGAQGLLPWQQAAVAGGWGQQDPQLHSLMQMAGVTVDMQGLQQQQQQLLPASDQQHAVQSLAAADAAHSADQQAEQAAVQQAALFPSGFPRITAMSRDPSNSSDVNLLSLANSGANLQQQMERILQQQQQQYQQYSAVQPGPGEAPAGAAAVGWRVGVFSHDAGAFYYGQLSDYSPDSGSHAVEYDDGLAESVQLQQARVDWVRADGHDLSQAGKQAHQAYMQQRVVTATAEYQQQKQLQQQQAATGADQRQQLVVQLQLQLQQTLAEIQQLGLQPGVPAPHHLQQRTQQLVLMLQHQQPQKQLQSVPTQQHHVTAGPAATPADDVAAAAVGSGPKPGPKPGAPSQVDIICGSNTAVFDCTRMAVLMPAGGYISPTEFERLSGKGSSKKWKCTMRVRKANGLPGITMGDWLIQMGYDQPRQPAAGVEGSGRVRTSLNDIRRQYTSRKAAGPPPPPAAAAAVRRNSSSGSAAENVKTPAAAAAAAAGQSVVTARGVALHRDGCMCVICKQARRKAAQEAGRAPNPEDAYVPRQPGEGKPGVSSRSAGYSSHAKRPLGRGSSIVVKDGVLGAAEDVAEERRKKLNLPTVLVGKRAYVRAVPQLVRGAAAHQLWQIPKSRSYTAEEWEALHATSSSKSAGVVAAENAGAADAGPAAGGSRAGTPSLSGSRGATPPLPAATGDVDAFAPNSTVAGAAAALQLVAEQQGRQPTPPQQQLQVEKQEKKGSRTQTWREKLRVCQALENKRITFGKSGIHGWGIFARADIPQDTMVTEFRGQLVRCILADVREHGYRKEHRDCYMFHATDETVIDNTKGGNYARFTNHCCHPCLYAKPLELGGELHLCFFARTDIKLGQELTFDYRFKEEEGDDKILCQCGAPNCKGTLN